jgi:hypothetical protein
MIERSRPMLVVLAAVLLAACADEDVDLPAPRSQKPLFVLEGPCGLVPPPPPPGPILSDSPTDLGTCLPADYPDAAVTIQLQIAPDGRARPPVSYYDQCSGTTFQVPEAVQDCLTARLREWRWVPIEMCPSHPTDHLYVVSAVRPTRRGRVTSTAASSLPPWTSLGCAG